MRPTKSLRGCPVSRLDVPDEPEIAVGADRQFARKNVSRGQRILGHNTREGHPADESRLCSGVPIDRSR